MRNLIIILAILLGGVAVYWFLIRKKPTDNNNRIENRAELKQSIIQPHFVKGNQFKHFALECKIDEVNMDKPYFVPDGPMRGKLKPENKVIKILPLNERGTDEARGAVPDPVLFKSYSVYLDNAMSMGIPPDVSGASSGDVFLTCQNSYARMSLNGGISYNTLDPTTIFPSNWDIRGPGDTISGPMCCDQVIQYIPSINRFIWFMQFWGTCPGICGKNKIRIASASPEDMRATGGTAWTYWDIYGEQLGTGFLDYPDMAFGDNNLYISIDDTRNRVGGLEVMRLPLAQIRDNVTLYFQYTDSCEQS